MRAVTRKLLRVHYWPVATTVDRSHTRSARATHDRGTGIAISRISVVCVWLACVRQRATDDGQARGGAGVVFKVRFMGK